MEIRFYIDPETGQPHIYDHGVSEDEVREVLRHPGEDRRARGRSRIAMGQTSGGRYLRIVYSPDDDADSVFVVTAYELRGKSLKAYRRHRRKRR